MSSLPPEFRRVPDWFLQLTMREVSTCGTPGAFTVHERSNAEWLGAKSPDIYECEAAGTSMTGAGIEPGDVLVVDASCPPTDGCIVVAAVPGEGMTAKRYFRGLLYSDREGRPSELHGICPENVWVVIAHVRSGDRLRKSHDQWERERAEALLQRSHIN